MNREADEGVLHMIVAGLYTSASASVSYLVHGMSSHSRTLPGHTVFGPLYK